MNKDRIILNINPQTNIRSTQGAAVLFRIPEACPQNCGLPRKSQKQPLVTVETMKDGFPDLWQALGGDNWQNRRKKKTIRYGCPHCLAYEQYRHKKRLEKYNIYKEELKKVAAENNLVIPSSGCSIYFYIPMASSWSNKKRKELHGQVCTTGVDIDNYYKAFSDGLYGQDKFIGQLSGLGKFWIDTVYKDENGKKKNNPGHIEILLNQPVYNPFSVTFIEQKS